MADPNDNDAPVDWSAPNQIDRSSIADELQQKPWLAGRLNEMVRGEVGGKASEEVRRIQMESAMNRALTRGHSLEQALWDTGAKGSRGYYPPETFSRGRYPTDAFVGDLQAVLAGSNYGGKYSGGNLITGNASGGVASRQFGRGTPGFTMSTGSGPESYFSEGPFRMSLGSFPSVPSSTAIHPMAAAFNRPSNGDPYASSSTPSKPPAGGWLDQMVAKYGPGGSAFQPEGQTPNMTGATSTPGTQAPGGNKVADAFQTAAQIIADRKKSMPHPDFKLAPDNTAPLHPLPLQFRGLPSALPQNPFAQMQQRPFGLPFAGGTGTGTG